MTCTNFGFSKNIQELKKSILGRLVWLHVCLTAIFMVYLYTFIRKLFPQPVGAQFFDRTQRKLQIQDSAMECLIWLWARCQGYHWMYVRTSGLSNLVCGICKQVFPPPPLAWLFHFEDTAHGFSLCKSNCLRRFSCRFQAPKQPTFYARQRVWAPF